MSVRMWVPLEAATFFKKNLFFYHNFKKFIEILNLKKTKLCEALVEKLKKIGQIYISLRFLQISNKN